MRGRLGGTSSSWPLCYLRVSVGVPFGKGGRWHEPELTTPQYPGSNSRRYFAKSFSALDETKSFRQLLVPPLPVANNSLYPLGPVPARTHHLPPNPNPPNRPVPPKPKISTTISVSSNLPNPSPRSTFRTQSSCLTTRRRAGMATSQKRPSTHWQVGEATKLTWKRTLTLQ